MAECVEKIQEEDFSYQGGRIKHWVLVWQDGKNWIEGKQFRGVLNDMRF